MGHQNLHKVLSTKHLTQFFINYHWFLARAGFLLIAILSLHSTGKAQLNVTADQSNARYQAGQAMNFVVTSNSNGNVDYTIKYDNDSPPIQIGSISISAGQAAYIPFSLNSPGVVLCEVNNGTSKSLAGAAFSPFEIQPLEPEPTDLEAFWEARKAELANVPISPSVNPHATHAFGNSYTLELGNIDGRKVYGYITVPTGAGPFPAIITLPPAGNNESLVQPQYLMAERAGVLAVSLSIHNVPADETDPNGYLPNDIADPLKNYYRYGVLGAIRAIDYIFTRPDFDGENIGLVGVSQGGGLSTIVAGIDERVKLLAISNPAFGQHAGLKYDQASPYPFYVRQSNAVFGTPAHEAATIAAAKYYDAMYFAKRYKGPVLAAVSYEDDVTPAATSLAIINQFPGNTIVVHAKELGHIHPPEYWNGRYDFFRKHFPSTLNAPWPYTPTTTGFFANAGQDASIPSDATANLSGSVQKDGAEVNLPVEWALIAGPGTVDFSSSNSKNTSVTFSEDGEYVLTFRAYDDNSLASDDKFFSISDRITVTVGGSGDFLTLTCPGDINVVAIAGETSAPATWPDPTVSTTCPGGTTDLFQIAGQPNGSVFSIGTTTISYEATDTCSNFQTCSFNVTINLANTGGTDPNLLFEAKKDGARVLLDWLSQTNHVTESYTVERSTDSINFLDLIFIENETSDEIATYFEYDQMPNLGANYYRLRQTFLDGSSIFSEVKKVFFDATLAPFAIYPNPAHDAINVDLSAYTGGSGDLQIYNLLGQPMETVTIDQVPELPYNIPLENYEDGFYFLLVNVKGAKVKLLPFVVVGNE